MPQQCQTRTDSQTARQRQTKRETGIIAANYWWARFGESIQTSCPCPCSSPSLERSLVSNDRPRHKGHNWCEIGLPGSGFAAAIRCDSGSAWLPLLLLLLEVLPVLRAAHLSVQTSVKLLRCPKSPKEIRPKALWRQQQHVLCHAGWANRDNCGSTFRGVKWAEAHPEWGEIWQISISFSRFEATCKRLQVFLAGRGQASPKSAKGITTRNSPARDLYRCPIKASNMRWQQHVAAAAAAATILLTKHWRQFDTPARRAGETTTAAKKTAKNSLRFRFKLNNYLSR